MTLNEQYVLDAYRAAQHGAPAPPVPGTHDVAVYRELREYRRFRAVVAGRPARGRIRAALRRLAPHRGQAAGC
ncbi:hypothetical protein GTW43_33200 [Streptomyces sp. SID5785]|uniref:hypothetical protein n=1 Tax=Streptomyces sp. SID5785 TaxID=2690309 RepID=UPI0013617BBD|nr:hypothetical protein [Streptomyces sp. SID5785]MZD09903.1 hypothetical protein [Streptomyces sp. SID5785]